MNPDKLKKIDKSKIIIIVLGALGLLLILLSTKLGGGDKTKEEYTDLGFYTEYLENKIVNICKKIKGISEAEVFLTLDCSSEYVCKDDGASDLLILTDVNGKNTVKLCEIYPKVRGIAVVCTGGDEAYIKEKIVELLSAALGLPSNKIKVAGSG